MFIKKLLDKVIRRLIGKLGVLLHEANSDIAHATLPKFGNDPKNLTIELPRRIINAEHIFLGEDTWLGPGSFLIAITHYPGVSMRHSEKQQKRQSFTPRISIGNRVTSTAGLQVAAMSEVIIEDDVMFGPNVNITDGLHGYENANEPYKYQRMFKIKPIRIKQGCWIGQNVVILPGVTIGEFSIIGANSLVNKSLPDKCIAVGNPANVIKIWDENTQSWISAAKTAMGNKID